MRETLRAATALTLCISLLGIAPPDGPNDHDLTFLRDDETFRAGEPIELPVHLENNDYKRISFGCMSLLYRIQVAVDDANGHRLDAPRLPPATITRCSTRNNNGLEYAQTLDFNLPLVWYGYTLSAGTYTVHAVMDASLDNSSSTRVTVGPA